MQARASRGAWTPVVTYVWCVVAWKILEMLFAYGATVGGFGWVTTTGTLIPATRFLNQETAATLIAKQTMITDSNEAPLLDPRVERVCLVLLGSEGLEDSGFEQIAHSRWVGPTALLMLVGGEPTYQTVLSGIDSSIAAAQATGSREISIWFVETPESEHGAAEDPATRCSTDKQDVDFMRGERRNAQSHLTRQFSETGDWHSVVRTVPVARGALRQHHGIDCN